MANQRALIHSFIREKFVDGREQNEIKKVA
jgi:hypothetical protein